MAAIQQILAALSVALPEADETALELYAGGNLALYGGGLLEVYGETFSAPSWRAAGTVGAETTGTTVSGPLPTYSENDILIAGMICRGSSTAFTMPGDWFEIQQLTVDGNQFAWFWKRASASESAPTVTNAGRTATNLLSAQLISIQDCKLTGLPFESVVSNSSTSGVLEGAAVDTSSAKRLALQFWIRGANSASGSDGEWIERIDQGTSGGGACRYMVDTAELEYAATIQGAGRASSAQLYGMIGLGLIGKTTDTTPVSNTLKRGLWVWDSTTTVLGDATEEDLLLEAVADSGITDLYIYSPQTELGTMAADYRAFIAQATAQGVRCWGLDGFRGWFSDGDGPAELYDTVDALIAYNAASASNERFVGFQIDMEPADIDTFTTFHNGIASSALSTTGGSGDWQSTEALDREFLMRDWVEIHAECRLRLNAAGLDLGTALPTWFDDYFGEPIVCTYDSVEKNVFLHLADNADDIVIMNYNTNPLNQITRLLYEASAATAPLSTGIETVVGLGSTVTYGDATGKQTRVAALADLDIVRARFQHYPNFYGDAIHDWAGWKALPADTLELYEGGVLELYAGGSLGLYSELASAVPVTAVLIDGEAVLLDGEFILV